MSEVLRLRQPVFGQELFTAQVAKTIERDDEVRRVAGAPRLSAAAAVAVRGALRLSRHFELDTAAQAASANARHTDQGS